MALRKRILFGMHAGWGKAIRLSADPRRFDVVMSDLAQAETLEFDAVVPLTLADHAWVESAGPDLPALPVPRAIRRLCHDKLMLNRRLVDLGCGDHIPRLHDRLPADPSRHPVIIKARKGAWGDSTDLLLTNVVPEAIITRLAASTHFIQDFIPGRREYATHVLMHHGVPQMVQTREYDMGDLPAIKGANSGPLGARWLAETPWLTDLLNILKVIGFDQGTCCIDYRVVDGVPLLFEINPRFGGSMSRNVTPYLEAYLTCLDRDLRRGFRSL